MGSSSVDVGVRPYFARRLASACLTSLLSNRSKIPYSAVNTPAMRNIMKRTWAAGIAILATAAAAEARPSAEQVQRLGKMVGTMQVVSEPAMSNGQLMGCQLVFRRHHPRLHLSRRRFREGVRQRDTDVSNIADQKNGNER